MAERSRGLLAPPWRHAASAVAALAFVGYFAIARVVVDLFPFSAFPMFASSVPAADGDVRACHLLAVGPDGAALDVNRFRSWSCPPWEDASERSITDLGCGAHRNVEEHIRAYLREESGTAPAAVPVALVRRRWTFGPSGPPAVDDRPVAACRAVPR